jgi:2-methylaconitate cis-trans-isomerase PrpF
VVDTIPDVPGLGDIQASLIDCANPCIFVRAADLKVDGAMLSDAISAHPTLLDQLEDIRRKGSVLMGLTSNPEEAAAVKSVPKMCFVSESAAHTLLSGKRVDDPSQADVLVRTISTLDPHRAIPITVAICTAAAANLEGSVVQSVMKAQIRADPEGITLAHPSGKIVVAAEMKKEANGEMGIESGTIYRTARKLFEGQVFYKSQ